MFAQVHAPGCVFFSKAAFMLLWTAASYAYLVFFAGTWWQAGLGCISLAFALGGVAFSIQHDANHGALGRRWRVLGLSLDTLMDNLAVTRMTGPDGSPKPRYVEVLKIEAAEPVPGGRGQLRSRVQVYRVFEQASPTPASKTPEIKVYRLFLDRPIKNQGGTEDEVRSAISLACSLAGFSNEDIAEKLKLAVHPASGLLIVSAPKDLMSIADTVISAAFGTPAAANANPDAR